MLSSIKTQRDLVSSLKGSSFRRVTCDGRSWLIREVRTLRRWSRDSRPAVNPPEAVVRVGTGQL
jgi:hypothetical protein